MIVRNVKKGYATLHFKDGVKSRIFKIQGGETVTIPELRNVSQVVNKFLFNHGHLVEVTNSQPAPQPEPTPKKKATKRASKVEKAKEQTENYIADINQDGKVDEEDLSIVHKAYSAEKKKKQKSSKKD
jgi:hypothetical protein